MKVLLFLMCICTFLDVGCATKQIITLGPEPDSPEVYMNVYINSIPSGADVYEADEDGILGKKLALLLLT